MTEILYNDRGEPIGRTDHIADINRLLDLADFRKVSLVWIYASHLIDNHAYNEVKTNDRYSDFQ